jgi:hypothetical protein
VEGPHRNCTFKIELDLRRHADCKQLRDLASGFGFSGFDVLKENFDGFLGRTAKITLWHLEADKGCPLAKRWAYAAPQEPGAVRRNIGVDEYRALMMLPRRWYVVQVVASKVCIFDGESEDTLGYSSE